MSGRRIADGPRGAAGRAPELIAFGEPLLEFARLTGEDRPLFLQGYGGDTSNVAVAAARQGASVAALARLGRDGFGDAFEALWRREGVDRSLVQRDERAPTGAYFIDYDDEGHHFTYLRSISAATRMRPDLLPLDAIADARILHLSGITQAISEDSCDAAFAAVEHARAHGTLVSYDTNLRLALWPLRRARAVILATIPSVDLCLPGLEDAERLLGTRDPDEIADRFLELGAGTVVLKMGRDGALVATGDTRQTIASLAVAAVDATGAGDTFDGAFLAEILRGATAADAARHATVAAALSTLGHGAVAPMPTRARTLEATAADAARRTGP